MSLTEFASRLESVSRSLSVGARTLLEIDTNPVPAEWNHVTKVDPETAKKLPLAFPLYLAETSAVSVGGSKDVTVSNTRETFELVTATPVPVFHEPSAPGHVTRENWELADFVAIPEVLNGDNESLVGALGQALDHVRENYGKNAVEEAIGIPIGNGLFGDRIANFTAAYLVEKAVFEAYIIMNPESAAAHEANVTKDDLLSPREARERALAAQYYLDSEVIYLEYSGTFGGEEAVEILEAIDEAATWSRVWYGGGLDNRENAQEVLDAGASAVVVGNVFHQIAEEEAELFEQAREAADDAGTSLESWVDQTGFETWVDQRVDVGETNAAQYLATIPGVENPAIRAREALATGVELGLRIQSLAEEVASPDADGIREKLLEEGVQEDAFRTVTSESPEITRKIAGGLLGDRFDVEVEDAFVADHLGVELQ